MIASRSRSGGSGRAGSITNASMGASFAPRRRTLENAKRRDFTKDSVRAEKGAHGGLVMLRAGFGCTFPISMLIIAVLPSRHPCHASTSLGMTRVALGMTEDRRSLYKRQRVAPPG